MLQVLIELTVVSMTRIEPVSNREGGGGGKKSKETTRCSLKIIRLWSCITQRELEQRTSEGMLERGLAARCFQ